MKEARRLALWKCWPGLVTAICVLAFGAPACDAVIGADFGHYSARPVGQLDAGPSGSGGMGGAVRGTGGVGGRSPGTGGAAGGTFGTGGITPGGASGDGGRASGRTGTDTGGIGMGGTIGAGGANGGVAGLATGGASPVGAWAPCSADSDCLDGRVCGLIHGTGGHGKCVRSCANGATDTCDAPLPGAGSLSCVGSYCETLCGPSDVCPTDYECYTLLTIKFCNYAK